MKKLYEKFNNLRQSRKLAVIIAPFFLLSIALNYAVFKEIPPFKGDPDSVIILLNINLVFLLAFAFLVVFRILRLWKKREGKEAGSKLHIRLVIAFSLMAACPAIIMTLFSAYFFHFGIQTWFSDRVATAVSESSAVAEAYLHEHHQVIKADILAMANDLDRQSELLSQNNKAFNSIMRTQSLLRNLSEAIVFDSQGNMKASSGAVYTLELEKISDHIMEEADSGDVVLMTGDSDDRIKALVKLNNYTDSYLFVGRMVDPIVLKHVRDTREAASEYEALQGKYSELQIAATMMFFLVALVILFGAVWYGLVFAKHLSKPIGKLISAANKIGSGDLSARVTDTGKFEEFEFLANSFNRMTKEIQTQRNKLLQANSQLDNRRRFTETILAGVSSGVVAVDSNGVISMANNMMCDIFEKDDSEFPGTNISDFVPELSGILTDALKKPFKITQAEVPYINSGGSKRILLVRIAVENSDDGDHSAVLTFDDITELQAAQRKAAWADVARRIAHEIKNPLTPIQLSAERLRRRYLKQINQDSEVFESCIETIIRHVGDIGRMVNEFSDFARMPEPVLKDENIYEMAKAVVLFYRQARGDINFSLDCADDDIKSIRCKFDESQLRRALANLLQNAVDSIDNKHKTSPEFEGKIRILLSEKDEFLSISVSDSGEGLPDTELSKLAEPYVTMKEKGTGLGLAIVKKIMEDHGGKIIIGEPDWLVKEKTWSKLCGATFVLLLPLQRDLSYAINADK